MDSKKHHEKIVEQFTKQASGYTSIVSHSDALDELVSIASASRDDTVLDIACGSGIVACAFAKHVAHVTGIDLTERMLVEARKLQAQKGLENMLWEIGDVTALPYPDNQFSIVVSRFGFHHFLEPAKVLAEMIRVCKPNGVVMVVDVSLPGAKIDKYNEMEKLRDPSHVAALSLKEFESLFEFSGLKNIAESYYKMRIGLEEQLNASFPDDKEKLKNMMMNDIGFDNLGINVSQTGGQIDLYYPIHIFTGKK